MNSTPGRHATSGSLARRRLLLALPIVFFAALGLLLYAGLYNNPRLVPSPLIGKPVPKFTLPPVQGMPGGFSSTTLKGKVSLVNVFASWCVSCRDEHPILLSLKHMNVVPIYGLDYKDTPGAARAWLDNLGDPYTSVGADRSGRVAINWGVYGVPETFVINAAGRIAYKQIGPITESVLHQTILPLVRKLQREARG